MHETSDAGPRELAEAATLRRAQAVAEGQTTGQISNALLKQLIALAYSASLMREEGTYIRCQLHVPANEKALGYGATAIRFAHPIELTSPDVIRKLARACPLKHHAMMVRADGRRLFVAGLVEMRKDHQVGFIGVSSLSMAPGLTGTTVAIVGPGSLAVYDAFPNMQLRAGRIVSLYARFLDYPYLKKAFRPIIQQVFSNRAKFIAGLPDKDDPAAFVPYLVADTWQRLILLAMQAEHGGAFIIVGPNSGDQIEMKYRLEPFGLGSRMVKLWENAFWYPMEAQVPLQQIYAWRDAYAELDNATRSVAAFSEVDGAVILDGNLDVLGFGAKLAPRTDGPARRTRCVDPWTKRADKTLRQRIAKLGTRHGSAFRFCCANRGTIAFVVSQDGDVRVFVNDGGKVAMIEATEYPPRL